MSQTDPHHDVPCDEACGAYKDAIAALERPTSERLCEHDDIKWLRGFIDSAGQGGNDPYLVRAHDIVTRLTTATSTPPKNDGWTVCDVCAVNQSCDLGCDFVMASDACFESLAKLLSPRQAELQYATSAPPEVVDAWDAIQGEYLPRKHRATIDRYIRGGDGE